MKLLQHVVSEGSPFFFFGGLTGKFLMCWQKFQIHSIALDFWSYKFRIRITILITIFNKYLYLYNLYSYLMLKLGSPSNPERQPT